MKKNIYRILCLVVNLSALGGCITGGPSYMERDQYLGSRNTHLPATYQLGLFRAPIPGSPEMFGLPQTTEPGPFYQPQMNHFFSPTTKCSPITANIRGLCGNINFIRVNETFFRTKRNQLL